MLTMPTVSVLICTYNRHEMLRQALAALMDRTIEKPDEVVIVNGGDNRANEVIAEFASKYPSVIKSFQITNKNLANSRNAGLPHCTGDIVAMTDDDAEVFPDWITRLKQLHAEHPEAGAVGGAVIGASSANDFISRLADLVTFAPVKQAGYVRTIPGVNVSYKRIVLNQIGLQDETLFRGEDVDFNWRVKHCGYEVYVDPTLRVLHHHRPTLKKFFNQHYMYGRAYYLVRKKWPDMYCVYPHQYRRLHDYLKAVHFFVAAVYEPFLSARRLPSWLDKIRAVPVLFVNQVMWRGGMMVQWWFSRRKPSI